MSYADFRKSLREALDSTSTTSATTAQIRSAIFSILEKGNQSPPPISHETSTINALILEYLEWNGYKHAKSVLEIESGTKTMGRRQLRTVCGVDDQECARVPLLYGICCKNTLISKDNVV